MKRSMQISMLCFWLAVGIAEADNTMRVHFIDVGQGDATLLEFDCGAILIDTGGEKNDEFNSVPVLEAYLDAFFVNRPDLGGQLTALYLTHPHIDHTRGVAMVLEEFRPRNAISNGQEHRSSGSGGQKALHEFAIASQENSDNSDDVGLETVSLDEISSQSGFSNSTIDGLDNVDCNPLLRALWGELLNRPDGWSNEDYYNENNHSVVLRVDFGESSLLLTGDLEDDAIETFLLRYQDSPELLDVDVYQLGHHGSRNGTTPELVHAMSPEMAVVSMGPANREESWTAYAYGHPNADVLDQLQNAIVTTRPEHDVLAGRGATRFNPYTITQGIYGTGWDGTVVLEADLAGNWSVIRPLEGPGGLDAPELREMINVNTATREALETLPGIGPVKARAIVEFRETHGNFSSIEELDNVPGIGGATLRDMRAFISVD